MKHLSLEIKIFIVLIFLAAISFTIMFIDIHSESDSAVKEACSKMITPTEKCKKIINK